MFWDYEARPYRPLGGPHPDVFLDRKGRLWYAGTEERIMELPADPLDYEGVPSRFWHPAAESREVRVAHERKKRALDDARADIPF